MTKDEAITYMIEKIEKIEREQLASKFAVDTNKQKKETVENIMKALKEVQINNEDQQS